MPFYRTISPRQTQKLAAELAQKFLKKRGRKNTLTFALLGDLGSGKTTFVQGFLKELRIREKITSPTFVLIKNYKLRSKNYGNYKKIYHVDCYQIKKPSELLKLGLKEILEKPQNVVLIEWAEKIRSALSKNTIWLKFEHSRKENQRTITVLT